MKQLIIAAVAVLLPATSVLAQTTASTSPVAVYRGAPGPLVAAGPVGLVIGVGYGVYWLAKRRRRKTEV